VGGQRRKMRLIIDESLAEERDLDVHLNGGLFFFSFLFLDLNSEFRKGWIRDLLREGVEPNPGPTFLDLKDSVSKAFTSTYTPIIDAFFKWLAMHLVDGEDSNSQEITDWLLADGNIALSSYKQAQQTNEKQVGKVITRFLEELHKTSKFNLLISPLFEPCFIYSNASF